MCSEKMRAAFEKGAGIKPGVSYKGNKYVSPYRADADYIYTLNRDWRIFQSAVQFARTQQTESEPALGTHSDDLAVNRFATAMMDKLQTARQKGRAGWDDPEQCSIENLVELLRGHLSKANPGNWVDIANFCMMLHERGAYPATLVQPTPQVPDIGLLPRWELNLSQGGIDEDDCGQFVRFDDLEELLSATPSISEKRNDSEP